MEDKNMDFVYSLVILITAYSFQSEVLVKNKIK